MSLFSISRFLEKDHNRSSTLLIVEFLHYRACVAHPMNRYHVMSFSVGCEYLTWPLDNTVRWRLV